MKSISSGDVDLRNLFAIHQVFDLPKIIVNKTVSRSRFLWLIFVLGLLIGACFTGQVAAQTDTTAAGTVISNRATATFSDGLQNFTSNSNIVSITVAEVSGISITPDGSVAPAVFPSQTTADFVFTVNNTGNSSNQIRFPATGAGIAISGPGTASAAVIDLDNSGTISAGDTDILTNGADVISSSVSQGGSFKVLVRVSINAGATVGQSIQVTLGDAASGSPTYDNQAANSSGHEVRTVNTSSINGLREARGDISVTIDNPSQLLLTLTAPAGPILLGADITYSISAGNPSNYKVNAINLANAPSNAKSGVFIIVPIPAQTKLTTGQSFPPGTLYTTSPLSIDPLQAVYTSAVPSDLSTVTRIAFNAGTSLNAGATSSSFSFQVKVSSSANSSNPVMEIADIFGQNNLGQTITDQSGDSVANSGDGNANFTEGSQPGNLDGNGIVQTTTLSVSGVIMNGPSLRPSAIGPTNANDDFTNLSTRLGITAGPGGVTTQADSVIFTNTIANFSLLADVFIITAPSVPSGFKVEISTSAGLFWTDVTNGDSVSLLVLLNLTGSYLVRVTAPVGTPVLTGFDTTIRATLTGAPTIYNETINRLYTGYIRLDKTYAVTNGTGLGGPNDIVAGAVITFNVAYTNISSSGGTNNATLTASSITITENGNAGTNNWGSTTNMVVGSAADNHPGGLPAIITGDQANSTVLVDTVLNILLGPGQSGNFTYKRAVK